MIDEHIEQDKISLRFQAIKSNLNEKGLRIWAAAEAKAYGWGGIALVSKVTKISNRTIHKGLKELEDPSQTNGERIRKKGGGRKKITQTAIGIKLAIEEIVNPACRGDPESPLKWSSKSTRKIEKELKAQGYVISQRTVYSLLRDLDYSLQANKKVKEGSSHEDRDAQFNFINEAVKDALNRGQPVISIDTKKKENIGDFKNNGREYAKEKHPIRVKTHDFPNKKLGKAVPYGIYDIGENKGLVSVGMSADTAEFAVNAIRTWWFKIGKKLYPHATELIATADCGGSNGYRTRLWKRELQKLATETRLTIHVCHFPPGTSKWNKIEHKMFSFISMNWRGKPLISMETIINLIGKTTTNNGLTIKAFLDNNTYQKGIVVTQAEMEAIHITGDDFHPEWNYAIAP
jgi:hypothetical protein